MNNIIDKIINVSGGNGGTSHLIIGDKKTALIDSGMAYCASQLIKNIKNILGEDKGLDYILLTHSHYDHSGAVPYLKQEWPSLIVLAANYAENIFQRPNALKLIKALSSEAGKHYGSNETIDYDDDLMKVDQVISENSIIDLGDIKIKVIETPGHTQCSLSFLLNNEVLFLSETTGDFNSGKIQTSIINSYNDAMNSFEKCIALNAKYIITPHSGLVDENYMYNFWHDCLDAAVKSKEFVMQLYSDGYSEEKIYEEYKNVFFNEELKAEQPETAFELNTKAMIKTFINGK